MLEKNVVELWSTVVMRLHLKPMKLLWQLMKARLVSPPPPSAAGWCVFAWMCVWVSVGMGWGENGQCLAGSALLFHYSGSSLSLSGRGSAFSANTGGGFPNTHQELSFYTLHTDQYNSVFIRLITGTTDKCTRARILSSLRCKRPANTHFWGRKHISVGGDRERNGRVWRKLTLQAQHTATSGDATEQRNEKQGRNIGSVSAS